MVMESSVMTKKNWYNVFVLGVGFLLLFSAFQTTAFVQVCCVVSVNTGYVYLLYTYTWLYNFINEGVHML